MISLRSAATWTFVLAFFFVSAHTAWGEISFKSHGLELGVSLGIIVLALSTSPGRRALLRGGAVFSAVAVVAILYFWLRQGHPQWGSERAYLLSGLTYALNLGLVAAFATAFFTESLFVEVFWKVGRFAVLAALGGYFVTSLTGQAVLTHTKYGTPRVQGFLSEPSAWGPVVSAMLLLSLAKGSRRYAFLSVVVGVLTKSPVVMVVTAVSLPIFYLAHRDRTSIRKILIVGGVAVGFPLAVNGIQHIDPTPYLRSASPYTVAVGRLLSGITNVQSAGAVGTNSRYKGVKTTQDELRENGWTYTGLGPGSSDVYFPAKFDTVQAYSFFFSALFDFGIFGAGMLLLLLAVAVFRMRASPLMAILLPFVVASMLNSAEGWETYKFAALTIAVGAFGAADFTTSRSRRSREPAQRVIVSA
jgi:hypothetical protein